MRIFDTYFSAHDYDGFSWQNTGINLTSANPAIVLVEEVTFLCVYKLIAGCSTQKHN